MHKLKIVSDGPQFYRTRVYIDDKEMKSVKSIQYECDPKKHHGISHVVLHLDVNGVDVEKVYE